MIFKVTMIFIKFINESSKIIIWDIWFKDLKDIYYIIRNVNWIKLLNTRFMNL